MSHFRRSDTPPLRHATLMTVMEEATSEVPSTDRSRSEPRHSNNMRTMMSGERNYKRPRPPPLQNNNNNIHQLHNSGLAQRMPEESSLILPTILWGFVLLIVLLVLWNPSYWDWWKGTYMMMKIRCGGELSRLLRISQDASAHRLSSPLWWSY